MRRSRARNEALALMAAIVLVGRPAWWGAEGLEEGEGEGEGDEDEDEGDIVVFAVWDGYTE